MANKSILVVDDDEHFRALVKVVVTKAGYHLVESCDSLEALGMMQSGYAPDLILLDAGMPVFDPGLFLSVLRKLRTLENVPILVLSGVDPSRRPLPWLVAQEKGMEAATLLSDIRRYLR